MSTIMKYNKHKRYNPRKHRFLHRLLITNKKKAIKKKELVYEIKLQKLQDMMDSLADWVESSDVEKDLRYLFLYNLEEFKKFLSTFLTRSTLNNINYYTIKTWENRIDVLADEISKRRNPFFKLLYLRFKLSLDEFYRELGIK
ncbi:hypothetical protein E3E31_08705 [Thermococcus sp. M39]|uniref:hypothetical protein n=1 Tax=unclassified Thermococcus TaxID=2627626 RepID=UPI00143A22DE|nr:MULTISPECIES: hypothetical protein [unclassified Thermococcus]NJE08598.1 hypothetical protein [Thermococcus sp. M39]NJE13205.1 hypothetical protein [Thermococcus sp. LS2]